MSEENLEELLRFDDDGLTDPNDRLDAGGRIDPTKIHPDEWRAGQDEFKYKGGSKDNIPLQPSAWDALISSWHDRMESAPERYAEAEHERRRRKKAVALFRQEAAIVPRDAAAINEAQAAYNKRRDQLIDSLKDEYFDLSADAQTAYDASHEEEGGLSNFSIRLRSAPNLSGDIEAIIRGAASDEYKQFAAKCASAAAEIMMLRKKVEALRNPSPDDRKPLQAWTRAEITKTPRNTSWLMPGIIPDKQMTVGYGAPKDGKSAWAQKLSVCVNSGIPFDGIC